MNLPKTEQIRLQDSKAVFAVGFDCDSNGRFRPNDVFDLESRHIIYSKTIEGIYAKDKRLLPSHYCKYEDFYNDSIINSNYLSAITLATFIKNKDILIQALKLTQQYNSVPNAKFFLQNKIIENL